MIYAWSIKYRWKQKIITQFVCKSRDESFKSSYFMIGQYLSNKNEIVTVSKSKNFSHLNRTLKASMVLSFSSYFTCVHFFRNPITHADVHKYERILTHINTRTHIIPLWAPPKNQVEPANLKIDEVIKGVSLLIGTSSTTKSIASLNPWINLEKRKNTSIWIYDQFASRVFILIWGVRAFWRISKTRFRYRYRFFWQDKKNALQQFYLNAQSLCT